jgi:hypothetical protein
MNTEKDHTCHKITPSSIGEKESVHVSWNRGKPRGYIPTASHEPADLHQGERGDQEKAEQGRPKTQIDWETQCMNKKPKHARYYTIRRLITSSDRASSQEAESVLNYSQQAGKKSKTGEQADYSTFNIN